MARQKSRWGDQSSGKRSGSLSRAVGVSSGRKIPSRLMKAAVRGKYGARTKKRAQAARRSSR